MQSQYVNAWLGEPFRLVAESGTDPNSFGEEKTILSKNGIPYKAAVVSLQNGQRILASGNLYILRLDSAFATDADKINVTEIFKNLSPDTNVKVI